MFPKLISWAVLEAITRQVVVTLITLAGVYGGEYKGRYTRGIEDYTIVVPQKVSEDATFVSYYLPHFYNIARVKRGLDTGNVNYMVSIEGADRVLELKPSEDFHAPGLVIEHQTTDAKMNWDSIKLKKPRPARCYYQGKVRGVTKSSAAITTCSGLAGSITLGPTQYLIEPIDDGDTPSINVKHKHLLYKRSQLLLSNRSRCGTADRFTTAFRERMKWEEKYGEEVEASMKGPRAKYETVQRNYDYSRKKKFCSTCSPNKMKTNEPCRAPKPLFIELLLVVGPRVASSAYLADDVEQFVNTIVNIAVKQFQDSSLGEPIVLKLVRVITVDYLYDELDAGKNNPQKVLQSFCQWQMHFNPSMEDHPNHHDFAIYIVKFEMCQGEILGLTNTASMCRPDKSCAVVSDEGLLTGNIITHMLGHALGAEHDDSSTSSCAPVETDGTANHMGIDICSISSSWSVCSKQSINQFVKTHASWCLADLPTATDLTYPVLLPGQIYSAAEQCRINFEMDSSACMVGEFCKRLYCRINDKECISMGDPPAQGTQCGPNLWCFNGKCVHRGSRPGATNGEWGEWSPWSHCTKTCGGGVQTAHRSCDSPAPSHGGKMCPGEWLKTKICNIGGCPDSDKGFLDEQCQWTNEKPYHGKKHSWRHFKQQLEELQCVVICVNELNQVAVRNPIAVDGTFCKPAHKDVCIRGSCRPVGCDWGIDSNAKEDACGVCHGNGTECRIMQGFFGEHNVKGVLEFLKLPIGASMVLVRETRPSPCFFSISNSLNHSSLLNGDWEEQLVFSGTFSISGSIGVYQTKGNMERIFLKEPLAVPITISSVCNEEEGTLGILYQYALPEAITTASIPTYTWEFLSWEKCPSFCGGGAQRAIPVCVEAEGGEVEDCYCSELARPPDKVRVCNEHLCEGRWWVGPWANCDSFHQEGMTTRMVMCVLQKEAGRMYIEIVSEEKCKSDEKPMVQKPCDPEKEKEIWGKVVLQKRDIWDMIPATETAEEFNIWDGRAEVRYSPMVNVRKMLAEFDPERLDDYKHLRKIGLISAQWLKRNEYSSKMQCPDTTRRILKRRNALLEPTTVRMRSNVTSSKRNKASMKTTMFCSKKTSVTEKPKSCSRNYHKELKVARKYQKDKGVRVVTSKGQTVHPQTGKHSEQTTKVLKQTETTSGQITTNIEVIPTTTVTKTPQGNDSHEATFLKTVGFSKLTGLTTYLPTSQASVLGVKNISGSTPNAEYYSEAAPARAKCWRSEMKASREHPTCLPAGNQVLEPAEEPPEVDFLNTSNIEIYVVPIMTTVRSILQNDQEFVLMDTLAKWPVADELAVIAHWGEEARKELKLAKDRALSKNNKKIAGMVQD